MKSILKAESYEIVAVDEIDYLDRIKLSSVLQYFQNIATSHAEALGVGYGAMLDKNLFWVITRISFVIDRYPKLHSKLKIITYPKKANIADCVRDFIIKDSDITIIRGSSKWCAVDCETKAIKRCKNLFDYDESRFYSGDTLPEPNPLLPRFEFKPKEYTVSDYRVLLTEIDRNFHKNNARYGDCVLNSCDKSFLDRHSVARFDINFISELAYNEKYSVKHHYNAGVSHFQATADEREIFRARIEWVKTADL